MAQLVEERGLYFVHPANEAHLINGVATEFFEILEILSFDSQAACNKLKNRFDLHLQYQRAADIKVISL